MANRPQCPVCGARLSSELVLSGPIPRLPSLVTNGATPWCDGCRKIHDAEWRILYNGFVKDLIEQIFTNPSVEVGAAVMEQQLAEFARKSFERDLIVYDGIDGIDPFTGVAQ